MLRLWGRAAFACLMPLLLAGCVLAPGKFVSKLVINADRSFTYSYVGEVYAIEMNKGPGGSAAADDQNDPDDSSYYDDLAPAFQHVAFLQDKSSAGDFQTPVEEAADKAKADAKNKALAAMLMKETGYRKVEYLGNGKFSIDYAIAGKLDHTFLWPYNLDAEVVFPFIAIELRANGTVRVKAPGFADDSQSSTAPGLDDAAGHLDGVFTLDTDATIVSQNEEDGAAAAAGGRQTVTWKATPLLKTAPMAVLRMK